MIPHKYIKQYMKMAKVLGEASPCYSRQIGSIVVNWKQNKVVGVGLNGPPKGTPHMDDPTYLARLWDWLNAKEHATLAELGCWDKKDFVKRYTNCGLCPRKVLGYESGQRLDICVCVHSELNALINSSETFNCWLFAWCPLPCNECCKAIINSGITRVHCLKNADPDYSPASRPLLKDANIDIREFDLKEIFPL